MRRTGMGSIGKLEGSDEHPADKYLKNSTLKALHEGDAGMDPPKDQSA